MSDDKPQRMRSGAYAICYAAALPQLVAVAREHGYALAVHGSMMTDLDLIACPWTEEATDAETLIEALRVCVNGRLGNGYTPQDELPRQRPHGRRCWPIFPNDPAQSPYLDVSVMPRRSD